MELDPLPCLLRPSTGSYPEPEESSHHTLLKIIALFNNYIIFSKIHHFFLDIRTFPPNPF
jgi:hypothetical protein